MGLGTCTISKTRNEDLNYINVVDAIGKRYSPLSGYVAAQKNLTRPTWLCVRPHLCERAFAVVCPYMTFIAILKPFQRVVLIKFVGQKSPVHRLWGSDEYNNLLDQVSRLECYLAYTTLNLVQLHEF